MKALFGAGVFSGCGDDFATKNSSSQTKKAPTRRRIGYLVGAFVWLLAAIGYSLFHFTDPALQRGQLLCVFVASLVVAGNGSGDGRERNSRGGRISTSGGVGNATTGGCVVQADKASRHSAMSIGFFGDINGNLLGNGHAALPHDFNPIDVLGNNFHRGHGLSRFDGLNAGMLFGLGGLPVLGDLVAPGGHAQAKERGAQSNGGKRLV